MVVKGPEGWWQVNFIVDAFALHCIALSAMRGREEGGKKQEEKEGRKVETVNIDVFVNVKSCPLCQPAKHGKKVNVTRSTESPIVIATQNGTQNGTQKQKQQMEGRRGGALRAHGRPSHEAVIRLAPGAPLRGACPPTPTPIPTPMPTYGA